jgi:hypothetical protein
LGVLEDTMRRFRLLDTTGAVRGEGVQWDDRWLSWRHLGHAPVLVDLSGLQPPLAAGEGFDGLRVEWETELPVELPDNDSGHIWCRGREFANGAWRWTGVNSCSRCAMPMAEFPNELDPGPCAGTP